VRMVETCTASERKETEEQSHSMKEEGTKRTCHVSTKVEDPGEGERGVKAISNCWHNRRHWNYER